MQRLPDDQRLAAKLSFLGPASRDHLLRPCRRATTHRRLEADITIFRRLLRDLPPERRPRLPDKEDGKGILLRPAGGSVPASGRHQVDRGRVAPC